MSFLLLALGCAEPAPETTPFEGPGYDPDLGLLIEQDRFILAVTELHVVNAPKPGATFGDHADAIGTYLYDGKTEIPGFVGGSFRNIGKLSWWTMTVWTDEASMMDFVLSEPHVNAMADLSYVASAARSTHVDIAPEDVPVDWEMALGVLEGNPYLIGEAP